MTRKICKICDEIKDSENDFRRTRAICRTCEKIQLQQTYLKRKESEKGYKTNKEKIEILKNKNTELMNDIEKLNNLIKSICDYVEFKYGGFKIEDLGIDNYESK